MSKAGMAFRQFVATAVIAALLVPALPLAAQERTVRCESRGRLRECRVDTDGQVRLERERSYRKCLLWRTWGYDKRRVWVDGGCRADFRVGKDGLSTGAKIAIGAGIAGGAALLAILATRDRNKPTVYAPPPSWAVGRFSGFNPRTASEIDLEVTANGEVTGNADTQRFGGRTGKGDVLILGNADFNLKRETWGFTATYKDDSQTVIYFRRQ